jgi:hypothetical protein
MELAMPNRPDWEYHLIRSAQCRRMALLAADDGIRHLHESLADSHAALARSAFHFEGEAAEPHVAT